MYRHVGILILVSKQAAAVATPYLVPSDLLPSYTHRDHYGDYIWIMILSLKVIDQIVDYFLGDQLREELLKVPVMTVYALTQVVMTLSANDFLDFLSSYLVGFGFTFLTRMYIDPNISRWIDLARRMTSRVLNKMISMIPTWLIPKKAVPKAEAEAAAEATERKRRTVEGLGNRDAETVEPILGFLSGYTADTMVLLYTPIMIILLIIFR